MTDLRKAAEAALEAMDRRNSVQGEWKLYLQEAADSLRAALEAQPPPVPEWPCYCDERGIGQPGVTCGDCPRDYGHKVAPAPADHAVSGASAPVGLPAGEQTGPVAEAPTYPPAPTAQTAALDRMAADAERLGLYDEPAEVPLPSPKHHVRVGDGKYRDAYTADQMKQYAAACVAAERERCARLCEKRWTAERLQKMRDEGWSTAELSGYEAALESVFNDIGSTGGSDA